MGRPPPGRRRSSRPRSAPALPLLSLPASRRAHREARPPRRLRAGGRGAADPARVGSSRVGRQRRRSRCRRARCLSRRQPGRGVERWQWVGGAGAARPRSRARGRREKRSALVTRPSNGNTEPPVLPSSIQRAFLSVICSKCLRPFRGAPAIIIGCKSARLLIGSVGPYQRRIFQDL